MRFCAQKITFFILFLKKSLAQEVRQKTDISEHRRKGSRGLLTLRHGCWVAVRPVKGLSFYTKNEYNIFNHKLDAEYVFIRHFFLKKAVSPRKQ